MWEIDHFQYIKIHTWLRGLGKLKKEFFLKNVLFIIEPQDDFFCFIIPPSLTAKYEFQHMGTGLLISGHLAEGCLI